jgi:hypothetical protein
MEIHAAHQYLQFLSSMRTAQEATKTVGLDPYAELVLELVTHAWSEGQPLKVVQVMQQVPGLCTTTVHRRLKLLVTQDFIALTVDEANNRIKYVTPTARALALFAQRGKLVTDALES